MNGKHTGRGPNILLVVLDTLTVSAAGLDRDRPAMPFLGSLADRGAHFRRAVSNAPWTYPAHGSLFTGLLPSEHGMDTHRQFLVWEREGDQGLGRWLPPGPGHDPGLASRWLPALLARAGYETVFVSNNPWVGRFTGMEFGSSRVRDTASLRLPRWRASVRGPVWLRAGARPWYHAYRAVRGRRDMLAGMTVARVRDWVSQRDRSRPFFLFVNLVECHAPYLTPRSPRAVGAAGAGPATILRAMRLLEPRQSIAFNAGGLELRRPGRLLALHRAMQREAARYLDGRLRELVEATRERSRTTLACVTSDHGESFGEHGALWHGFTLDEPALRIPLVLAGDGVSPVVRDDVVDLRRIHATLLEAAGLNPPAGSGPSVLSTARPPAVAEREWMQMPSWASPSWPRLERISLRMRAIHRGRWKLVAAGSRHSLYDLESGGGEGEDVAGREPRVVADLLAALPPWPDRPQADRGGVAPPGRPDGALAPPEAEVGPALTPREEALIRDHLAGLGYLE